MMEKTLVNKAAVVTGVGSIIGKAAAVRLAIAGAKEALIDLKEEHAAKAKEEIKRSVVKQ